MRKWWLALGTIIYSCFIELSLASDNKHQEKAEIEEGSGSNFASGTKLQTQEAINAETFANAEEIKEDEQHSAEQLQAAVSESHNQKY